MSVPSFPRQIIKKHVADVDAGLRRAVVDIIVSVPALDVHEVVIQPRILVRRELQLVALALLNERDRLALGERLHDGVYIVLVVDRAERDGYDLLLAYIHPVGVKTRNVVR